MKKLLLVFAMALVAVGVSAQTTLLKVNWDGYEGDYPYWFGTDEGTDATFELVEDGIALINPRLQDEVWTPQIVVTDDCMTLEEGHDYVVRLTLKVPSDGIYQVQLGSWVANDQYEVPVKASADWQTVDVSFPEFWGDTDEDGHVIFQNGWVIGTTILKEIEVIDLTPPDVPVDLLYNYNDIDKTAEVIMNPGGKYSGAIVIPETVMYNGDEYTVTKIGDKAFFECTKLTTVSIPGNVTSIGEKAFAQNAKLATVTILSDAAAIGDDAFAGCTKAVLSVPPSAYDTYAASDACKDVKKIVEIGTGSVFTAHIANGMDMTFKVTKLSVPEVQVGDGDATAIDNNTDVAITIPSSVTDPNGKVYSVTSIGDGAFTACNYVPSVTIPDGVKAIGNNAFTYCYALESVNLPDGLVTIGNSAFRSTWVKDVSFPNSLKSIGEEAYEDCYGIITLVVPEGVESIGDYAFSYMGNLERLVLPSSLKKIGNYVIYYDGTLANVVSNITEPFIVGNDVFVYEGYWDSNLGKSVRVPSPATLYVPVGTKTLYEDASWTVQFTKAEEGEPQVAMSGVLKYEYSLNGNEATVIQDDSYRNLPTVEIPASVTIGGRTYQVTAIGCNAFMDCENLTSVSLANGLLHIGNRAFFRANLQEVLLPSTLKSIGEEAFKDCESIESILVPDGVERIGNFAFSDMDNLRVLIIPASVKKFGYWLISYSQNLLSVVSDFTTPNVIDSYTFIYDSVWDMENQAAIIIPSPATFYIPAATKSLYEDAGWAAQFANTIEMGSGVEGDANNDTEVDAEDIEAVVRYIMEGEFEGFIFDNANLNGDDTVDAADLVLLINKLKP